MFFCFFFGPPLLCALTLLVDWRAWRRDSAIAFGLAVAALAARPGGQRA